MVFAFLGEKLDGSLKSKVAGRLQRSRHGRKDSSVPKRLASRPSLAGECASEFETSVYPSSAERRQFIGGSEDRPVSNAWIWGVKSSKHSRMSSKPE